MNRAELSDRITEQFRMLIDSSKCTMTELAKKLDVSTKTIQKWKDGSAIPSFTNTFALFDACYDNPEYSLQCILRPDDVCIDYDTIKIDDLRCSINKLINAQDDRCLSIIHYIFLGNHGSDPRAYMQMGLANARATVGGRQVVALIIYHNYICAEAMGALSDRKAIQPDLPSLKDAILKGQAAYYQGQNGYVKYKKEMNEHYKKRLANEMRHVRLGSGSDVKTVAKGMHVSEDTIVKYENGSTEPNIMKFFDWLACFNVSPESVFRAIFHPMLDDYKLEYDDRCIIIEELRNEVMAQDRDTLIALHYMLSGMNHSSVYDFLQMSIANLQTPIGDRQMVATLIDNNYTTVTTKKIILPGPEPNMSLFRDAIRQGTEAYIKGIKGYAVK